ncbi:MAG: glutathione transferase GstA [Pseudomonadota bacterium]
MKLYYKPGVCSQAAHITLNEIGATFDLEQVDTKTKRTATGADYTAINPNGYVPALTLDDGEILLEGPAILQYLADTAPDSGLAPPSGTIERTRVQQYLNFTASELHKSFSPFFTDEPLTDAARQAAVRKLASRLDYVEKLLADGRPYLTGETFTIADAYLFVVASWTGPTGIGLDPWPNVEAFVARVRARPQVEKSMRAEGLLH